MATNFTLAERLGSYRLVRQLGEGSIGVVYEAVQEQLGRRVAIKVLHRELCADPAVAQRFFEEARALSGVQHPGLANIVEIGTQEGQDGTLFVVMEFLEGELLSKRLGQPARRAETMPLLRQVASALAAAHQRGIVHCDLKPDNVMIVPDPDVPGGQRAKILDFGLARLVGWQNTAQGPQRPGQSGRLTGSPAYMAPEQCRGSGEVDDKADVYALGAMLYQLLAGRPPFAAEGIGDLIAMHIYEYPTPLRKLDPSIPEPLAELVHAMLAKSREARPTMQQAAAALERYALASGGGGAGETPSQRLRPGGPVPSSPAAAPAHGGLAGRLLLRLLPFAAAVVGLLGGLGLLLLLWRPDPEPPPPRPPAPRTPPAPTGLPPGEALSLTHSPPKPPPLQPPAPPLVPDAGDSSGDELVEDDTEEEEDGGEAANGVVPRRHLAGPRQKVSRREREMYTQFGKALAGKDYGKALQLYRGLPAASPYKLRSRQHFDKAFARFAEQQLRRAETAREAGRCAEAQVELQRIFAIVPDYPLPPERPCQEPAHARGPEGSRVGEAEVGRILKEVQSLYYRGSYQQAIELARTVSRGTPREQRNVAWRLIGASACRLREAAQADEAYEHLVAEDQQYVVLMCRQAGLVSTDQGFKPR